MWVKEEDVRLCSLLDGRMEDLLCASFGPGVGKRLKYFVFDASKREELLFAFFGPKVGKRLKSFVFDAF